MSSSDLNSDKSIDSKAIDDKEDLDALADSIDASLDAILSEAKEVAQPAADSESAPSVTETAPTLAALEPLEPLEPPAAEVQMAISDNGAGASVLTDDMETPLPVIVEEEEPSYKAFAEMVAPTEEPRSEPAPEPHAAEVLAESAEPESGEILDADELIDSMTPAPVLMEEAEAAVARTEESAAYVARTEESAAYVEPPSPPSDEEILDHVKLPPGSTPMPMPLVASTAAEVPGASLEDDQTVISPMPPMPEPSVSLPPPRRMNSAWATPAEPSILLAPSEGLGSKFGKMAKAPIQTSIATLAGVVLLASAVGGGVVRLLSGPPGAAKVAVTAPAQAETPAPAPAIVPAVAEKAAAVPAATPAVVEKVAEKVAEKPAEKAVEKTAAAKAPAKPAAKPAAAPQRTHMALAEPKPAPAKKPAAPAAKPKKAAATAWVDPFGQ